MTSGYEPLLEKGSYYLIATENDVLMGWVLIGASKDQFTDKMNGFIYELFIIEEFRGNGVSKQLMRTAIDYLRQDGYSEVRLSAFAGNQAIKLYEKMGFNLRTVTMSLPHISNWLLSLTGALLQLGIKHPFLIQLKVQFS